jgi:hypothetical protein
MSEGYSDPKELPHHGIDLVALEIEGRSLSKKGE